MASGAGVLVSPPLWEMVRRDDGYLLENSNKSRPAKLEKAMGWFFTSKAARAGICVDVLAPLREVPVAKKKQIQESGLGPGLLVRSEYSEPTPALSLYGSIHLLLTGTLTAVPN